MEEKRYEINLFFMINQGEQLLKRMQGCLKVKKLGEGGRQDLNTLIFKNYTILVRTLASILFMVQD
jgi:hypothetical protein